MHILFMSFSFRLQTSRVKCVVDRVCKMEEKKEGKGNFVYTKMTSSISFLAFFCYVIFNSDCYRPVQLHFFLLLNLNQFIELRSPFFFSFQTRRKEKCTLKEMAPTHAHDAHTNLLLRSVFMPFFFYLTKK